MKPIHLTAFADHQLRHGGIKRSLQLRALVEFSGSEVLFLPATKWDAIRGLLLSPLSALRVLPLAARLGFQHLTLRGVFAATVYGGWLYAQLRQHGWPDVTIEIAPDRPILLGNILVSLGIQFTAMPHNLEFMVPGQVQRSIRSADSAFALEMRIYRNAQLVQTISEFDCKILHALGVPKAGVLPYAPPEDDAKRLHTIRLARETSQKSFFLLLGTAANPPTRQGLERLFGLIADGNGGRRFVLAGFGTEDLTASAPSCVDVRGSVSNEELDRLMVHCLGLVVFQPPTSGMLTRLVEAAAAGVPTYVFGGYFQALELAAEGVSAITSLSDLPFAE